MKKIKVPTWKQVWGKKYSKMNILERFVFEHCPLNLSNTSLQNLIDWVISEVKNDENKETKNS